MRILRLDVGSDHRTVDLHPFVTVVHELEEAELRDTIAAVRSLAQGSTAGIRGLVQNQGLLVELDGAGHDHLPAITAANVVIDAETVGVDDLSWLRAQVDQQQRRAEIEAVIVEEIRADLDPSVRSRVAALEDQLASFDQDEIERRRRLADHVAQSLKIVVGLPATVLEAPAGVADLHQDWIALHTRLLEAKEHLTGLKLAIDRAQARLDSATAMLSKAEDGAKPVLLSREEEARLELLAFPSMDETRRGKWRKRLRQEELEEMAALLAKVGVESWTAYTVYRTSPAASPEQLKVLDGARAGVADAEAHLADMQADQDNDRRYCELAEKTKRLRQETRKHLGLMLPSDPAKALGELAIERENQDWVAAMGRLEQLLDENRIGLNDKGAKDPAVRRAETWLEAQRQGQGSLDAAAVERQVDKARGVLDRHHRALTRITRAEEAAAAAAIALAQLQEQLAARTAATSNTVEGLLAYVEPIATQVAIEAEGSLPIAVIGDLDGMDDVDLGRLLDRLSELSEGLQVLVITDRPAAREWARSIGLDRAMASRARAADTAEFR